MKGIHIANPQLLKEKIKNIKEDGNYQLHVISDFDRTLTPCFIDGQKTETGVGQIRAGGYLSPDYVKESYALKDKYYPIEVDESIPMEERNKKMLEWWQTHLKLMIKYKLNKEIIDDIIRKRKIRPREGSLEFYDILHYYHIPLIIFSAALGDLITGFLQEEGRFYNNLHIISNFYDYDEKGFVKGYKSDIVHTFNKNERQIQEIPCYEQLKKRKNIILLGDSIGDLGMTEGFKYKTLLRIGFLNENAEKLLPSFSEKYDVIILNDGSMKYVNKLLKEVLQD